MDDFDYESLFSQIQNEEYYTREETIKYIQQLFGCLLNHPLESLIHPQVFLALKKLMADTIIKAITIKRKPPKIRYLIENFLSFIVLFAFKM